MLVRGPTLAASMSKYLIDRIRANPAIELLTRTEIVDVTGTIETGVQAVRWRHLGTGAEQTRAILQARPETVKAREETQERFRLKKRGDELVTGRAIGNRIGTGTVRLVKNASEMNRVKPGDVLVTDMTDPDWEPVMKKASAIVTNRGGRTCHAAIIARELGIPAVVGD